MCPVVLADPPLTGPGRGTYPMSLEAFMDQLQAVFAQRLPEVTTKIVRTTRVYGHDDPETWEEIQKTGDAAIIGVGH